jgi:two-component system response regulator FixJ
MSESPVKHDNLRYDNIIDRVPDNVRTSAMLGLQSLTAREIDVLRRIASAKSNRQTADELSISPRTVEVHRRRVMRKLCAKNIADLVRILASLQQMH